MNGLRLARVNNEQVQLSGIDWIVSNFLLEVPKLLPQTKSGAAGERLFPKPSAADEKLNEDWAQFVVPELEKLFASAGEIMAKDIAPLHSHNEVTFPLSHCDAWMCAINQVRLALGAQHNITEADMDDLELFNPTDAKQQALLRVHVLGYVMEVFVAFLSPE